MVAIGTSPTKDVCVGNWTLFIVSSLIINSSYNVLLNQTTSINRKMYKKDTHTQPMQVNNLTIQPDCIHFYES